MAEPKGARAEDEPSTTQLDDDRLLARFRAWWENDFPHFKDWREEAREDFDFVAGKQWDEKALEVLKQQNRPASVFNRVGPMIDAVSGFEVSNRQEIRYIPQKLGASGVNQMLTSAAMWFRDQTDAEDEESDAFKDTAICGWGWTETRIDYEDNPDGDPRMDRVDPLEIFSNKEAQKPNIVDAKRIWRVRKFDLDEARSLFPDEDEADLHCAWGQDDTNGNTTHVYPGRDYDGEDDPDAQITECVIVECQFIERECFIRFADGATGEMQELSEEQFGTLMTRMEQIPVEEMMLMGIQPPKNVVKQYRRVYRRVFIGRKILGGVRNTPIEGHFTYKAMTGKRDRNKGTFYGLVRAMKDPQRWTNKLFSQIMHILNTNAKGGIMAEHGAFEDDRKAAEDWAKGDSIVWTSTGAITNGRIAPKPPTNFPQGQAQMLEFSMGAMPMVTGINLEFLGMRETNQPGVLEYQRRQAGVTILATLFDSLRRYRKDQGRLMLKMIQKYLSDDRLVRVVDDDQAMFIPLSRDMTLGEYEVVVDDAPSAPNAKDRNWEIINSMMPILGPMAMQNPGLTGELIKYSPLPESVSAKIQQAVNQPPPQPDPMQEQMKIIAMEGAKARIAKDAGSAAKSNADAMKAKVEAFSEGMGIVAQAIATDLPPAAIPELGLPPMAPPQRPQGLPPLMPLGGL